MADKPPEIEENYYKFSKMLPDKISANIKSQRGQPKLIESYKRVAALNALKIEVVSANFSPGAMNFFQEAHNDLLLSHVNANVGSWRSALQSLRSFIENTLAAIYFADHPVELLRWETGTFRIHPKDLREYIYAHPQVVIIRKEIEVESVLGNEYATLSKAVHSSSSLFRMTTSEGATNIGTPSAAELGKWSARERATVDICSLIICAISNPELDGAKRPHVRKALAAALLPKSKAVLKKHYGINIPSA